MESCQGDPDRAAWFCFRYGKYWLHPWRDLAGFVLGSLGPNLARQVGDRASVSIQITESGLAQGELTVRPGAEQRVIRALRHLGRDFSC